MHIQTETSPTSGTSTYATTRGQTALNCNSESLRDPQVSTPPNPPAAIHPTPYSVDALVNTHEGIYRCS